MKGKKGFKHSEETKKKIRERDKRICQICGCDEKENKQKLSVHHIDYDKENNGECNLISLCIHCHSATNSNRKKWVSFFHNTQIKLLTKKYNSIDIMIVTRDRPTELAMLLQSIRTQDFKSTNIFIMDDRSGVPLQQHHFLMSIINRMKTENHIVSMLRNDIPYGVTRLRQQVVDKIMDVGKGTCIARLDDDNLLEPNYFSNLLKCLDQGYDIASGLVPVCGHPFIKRQTKFVKPFISDVKINDKGEIIHFGDDCGCEYMEHEIIPSPNFRSMALIKKEVHEKVKYEDNLGFCSFREEQFFSFRAILAGFKIGVNTGAIAYHINSPSGGERTKEYYDGLNSNHEVLNDFCVKKFKIHGDFIQKYREEFK